MTFKINGDERTGEPAAGQCLRTFLRDQALFEVKRAVMPAIAVRAR